MNRQVSRSGHDVMLLCTLGRFSFDADKFDSTARDKTEENVWTGRSVSSIEQRSNNFTLTKLNDGQRRGLAHRSFELSRDVRRECTTRSSEAGENESRRTILSSFYKLSASGKLSSRHAHLWMSRCSPGHERVENMRGNLSEAINETCYVLIRSDFDPAA